MISTQPRIHARLKGVRRNSKGAWEYLGSVWGNYNDIIRLKNKENHRPKTTGG